ncbi:MAG: arsenite methyltransferase [Anaerolineales bacterium]|nr:arsenite methyltransferase [Anaerolineales bacterium]
MDKTKENTDVRFHVRERYGNLALESSEAAACCGPDCGCSSEDASGGSALYSSVELDTLPVSVTNLSLGCGNPVALASLQPGQVVVDLGSGGGIDCFLAARQVGPTGKVIGIDMTPKMIDVARSNQASMGVDNVEFRLGEIEHLPVSDQSVDVIISNCVINLSPDKRQVLQEAFRALRPGGRLAVSDVVASEPLSEELKSDLSAWSCCLGGAIETQEFINLLEGAGFENILIEEVDDVNEKEVAESSDAPVYQAYITAYRPA